MTQHTEIPMLITVLRGMGAPACDAAADEIERLRELVTDIREVVINHKDEIEHFDDDDLKALDSAGAVVFPRKD